MEVIARPYNSDEDFTIAGIAKPVVIHDDGVSRLVADEEECNHFCDLDLLGKVFGLPSTIVKAIPPKAKLSFSKTLKAALDQVISKPADLAVWIRLLVLPKYVLRLFVPKRNGDKKAANRKKKQTENVLEALHVWREPGGLQTLVSGLSNAPSLSIDVDEDLSLEDLNIRQCKHKLSDGHYTAAIRVLTSSGVAPYGKDTLNQLMSKHPIVSPSSIPVTTVAEDALSVSKNLVLGRIKSFPKGTSCDRDGLRVQHLLDALSGAASAEAEDLLVRITGVVNLFLADICPPMLGEFIASAPLTPLVKPRCGIRPIAVGTIWRILVSKAPASSVSKNISKYFEDLQSGVGVSGEGEAILHAVNRLVGEKGDDNSMSFLLVDFQNVFNLVDMSVMIREAILRCPSIALWVEFFYAKSARLYYGDHILHSCQGVQQGDTLDPLLFALVLHPLACKIRDMCELHLQSWYLYDGSITGDTLMVSKALNIILDDGPSYGLHLNVEKTELFWHCVDPRGLVDGIFPHNISRPKLGVKLLGGPVSRDSSFCNDLVNKRVAKSIDLIEGVRKLHDPQCELFLLRYYDGVSKLLFSLRTCSLDAFSSGQRLFDDALYRALRKLVTADSSGFCALQWRLATVPLKMAGLGIFTIADTMHYCFVASRLQTLSLQNSILKTTYITTLGAVFELALEKFAGFFGIDVLAHCGETPTSKLMCTMAGMYFKAVEGSMVEKMRTIARDIADWMCQKQPHAQDFLKVTPIDGLGKTMAGSSFRAVLCYMLCVNLFGKDDLCPCCDRKVMDPFGDHALNCSKDIVPEFHHDHLRDTMLDMLTKLGIPARREFVVGLLDDHGKEMKPDDLLLHCWVGGRDVCVDLTGISPFSGNGLERFWMGQAVTEEETRKKMKYRLVCDGGGLGFSSFGFTIFGELGPGAINIMKRVTYHVAVHFGAKISSYLHHRLSFSIAKVI